MFRVLYGVNIYLKVVGTDAVLVQKLVSQEKLSNIVDL